LNFIILNFEFSQQVVK